VWHRRSARCRVMTVDPLVGSEVVLPVARNRARMPAGRSHAVNVRLTDEAMRDVAAAAGRAGLTPTGYAGEAAVAASRAQTEGYATAATRAELARVQREVFAARAALVSVARAMTDSSDCPVDECAVALGHLDALAERVHGLLKRAVA
jgi:hypothetical protein